jgi:serine protease AprX
MVKKKIIAYFTDDTERETARDKMSSTQATNSFVVGEVAETDIDYLKQSGLIVEILEDKMPQKNVNMLSYNVHGSGDQDKDMISPDITKVGDASKSMNIEREIKKKTDFYNIQLQGPLIESWRIKLKAAGVRFLRRDDYNLYKVKMPADLLDSISSLPFVRYVQPSSEKDLYDNLDLPPDKSEPSDKKMVGYDILLHLEEDVPNMISWLKLHGINVIVSSRRKVRVYLPHNSMIVDRIRELPEVEMISLFPSITVDIDKANAILGITDSSRPATASVSILTQQGEGQIVAVADHGIDDSHPDLKDRILNIVTPGRPKTKDHSDPNGHGTHVVGCIVGDGTASKGKIRGIAPKAKIFFQDIRDENGNNVFDDMTKTFLVKQFLDEAYNAGARIFNASWGSHTKLSEYNARDKYIDDYLFEHPDMLVVVAAGNDGTAAYPTDDSKDDNKGYEGPQCTVQGYVDWYSLNSPGTCKNVITVGASRTNRTDGPYKDLIYGLWKPPEFEEALYPPKSYKKFPRFPDPPIANEKYSGNPECLAAFSSRGPPKDDYRRIKPDVVAPGTEILSTRSAIADKKHFQGELAENPKYAFMSGTSMAAPLVSGCAAIVREYYVKVLKVEPSAALLKATLINSTRRLSGFDALATQTQPQTPTLNQSFLPNVHQGFGIIDMGRTIPNPSHPNMKLQFADTWKDDKKPFEQLGDRKQYQFSSSSGEPLRICMVYNDMGPSGMQTQLNLVVVHNTSGKKMIGNYDSTYTKNDIQDCSNNVQIMRLDKPLEGDYTINVSANNLMWPEHPQHFAVVVTGPLISEPNHDNSQLMAI